MKHKIGDIVEVLSLDSINKHPKRMWNGELRTQAYMTSSMINKFAGMAVTIAKVRSQSYKIVEDNGEQYWDDEMFWDEHNNVLR